MLLKVRLDEIQREEEQIQQVRDLLRIRYETAHLHTNENTDSRCVYCQKKLKANWDSKRADYTLRSSHPKPPKTCGYEETGFHGETIRVCDYPIEVTTTTREVTFGEWKPNSTEFIVGGETAFRDSTWPDDDEVFTEINHSWTCGDEYCVMEGKRRGAGTLVSKVVKRKSRLRYDGTPMLRGVFGKGLFCSKQCAHSTALEHAELAQRSAELSSEYNRLGRSHDLMIEVVRKAANLHRIWFGHQPKHDPRSPWYEMPLSKEKLAEKSIYPGMREWRTIEEQFNLLNNGHEELEKHHRWYMRCNHPDVFSRHDPDQWSIEQELWSALVAIRERLNERLAQES